MAYVLAPLKLVASIAVLFCVVGPVACGDSANYRPSVNQPYATLRAPASTSFNSPVWLSKNTLVAEVRVGVREVAHLETFDIHDGTRSTVPNPKPEGCRTVEQKYPVRLRTGAVAYLEACTSASGAVSDDFASLRLLGSDLRTEPVLNYRFAYPTGPFALSADATLGIASDGYALGARLHKLIDGRVEPLPTGRGWAGAPTIQPGTTRFVFLAIPNASMTPDGLVKPATLFASDLADPDRRRPLLEGIASIHLQPASWYPGRPWVVIQADLRAGRGIWLVDVETGAKRMLLEGGNLGAAAVSPDGRVLAVARMGEAKPRSSEIALYRLPAAVMLRP